MSKNTQLTEKAKKYKSIQDSHKSQYTTNKSDEWMWYDKIGQLKYLSSSGIPLISFYDTAKNTIRPNIEFKTFIVLTVIFQFIFCGRFHTQNGPIF